MHKTISVQVLAAALHGVSCELSLLRLRRELHDRFANDHGESCVSDVIAVARNHCESCVADVIAVALNHGERRASDVTAVSVNQAENCVAVFCCTGGCSLTALLREL